MTKALAVVRTVFLVFIIGYTVRAMPWATDVARTFDEQYARCSESLALLARAAWIGIAWIGFETAVGWWLALRQDRRKLHAGEPPAGRPPIAPPPRG